MKRFDDYSEVRECTNCEHWWTNACDGPSFGSERPCTGFLACRRVSIPEDIKALQNGLKRLEMALILLSVGWVLSVFGLLAVISVG